MVKALVLAGLVLVVVAVVAAHPWLLVVVVSLAVLAWRVRGVGAGSAAGAMTAYIERGHCPEETARHEAGHVVAAQRMGAKVTKVVVRRDGSGYVVARGFASAADRIGFLRAGEYAIGSGRGAGPDRAAVRAVLREVPAKDRRAVLREGERRGRRAAGSGAVGGVADRIHRTGRV